MIRRWSCTAAAIDIM